MSRLPPLPPGLPPKPVSDSYRPGAPLHENYFAQQEHRDRAAQPTYHFGGGAGPRDAYRPRSPPRSSHGNYGPPPTYNAPGRPHGDNYRPPSGGFTFRYDAPPSISSRQGDSWRPASPPRHRGYGQENGNGFRPNDRPNRPPHHRSGAQRGGQGYRGRAGPRMASDRAFLKGNRAPTPELLPGVDDNNGVKYKRAEDLSDSDEAEMDMSEDENGDGQPAKKRAKTEATTGDGNTTHKWSNPDPYTVLPPPDESQRKKKDVVKLIRKARVSTGSGKAKDENEPADFISLDFGAELDDNDESEPEPFGRGVAGAPSGPRALLQPRQALPPSKSRNTQAPLIDVANTASNRRSVDPTRDDNLGSRKRNAYDEIKPDSNSLDNGLDPNLGSRKRSARDEILNPPPLLYKTTRGKPPKVDGQLLKEWKARAGDTSTPWHVNDHSDTASMGVW